MPKQLQLDPTPTGEEESRDFPYPGKARGEEYNREQAKSRIDFIARFLVFIWTGFLLYIVFIQGLDRTIYFSAWGYCFPIIPKFQLSEAEFIAVVTTTTASVFGFLVIIAKNLFRGDE